MKNKLILSSVLVLAACGLSESKFAEKFGEKLCEEYAACNPDIECTTGDDDDTSSADCTFDKGKANECLDGTYECDESFGEGFEFVVVPAACGEVYSECGGTTVGNTNTGNTNTAANTTNTGT